MAKKVTGLTQDQIRVIRAYGEIFATDSGKIVLEDLEEAYGGECHVPGDHYETLNRSSKRDFLTRIKNMIYLSSLELEEEKKKDVTIDNE